MSLHECLQHNNGYYSNTLQTRWRLEERDIGNESTYFAYLPWQLAHAVTIICVGIGFHDIQCKFQVLN